MRLQFEVVMIHSTATDRRHETRAVAVDVPDGDQLAAIRCADEFGSPILMVQFPVTTVAP